MQKEKSEITSKSGPNKKVAVRPQSSDRCTISVIPSKGMLDKIWNIATGEWLLERYPNGGKVIAARSFQVGLTIYLFAASIHSWAASRWSWRLSLDAAADEIAGTLPWLGGIVAAVYVALYTRFSAQWSYLANLYNQIMITHIGLESVQKDEVAVRVLDPCISATRHQRPDQDSDATDLWYAAFVEDAVALHLATKPIFAELIWQLIEDPSVQRAFDDSVVTGGAQARKTLRNKLLLRFPALADQRSSDLNQPNGRTTVQESPGDQPPDGAS